MDRRIAADLVAVDMRNVRFSESTEFIQRHLPQPEVSQIDKFVFERDKKMALASRALARRLISRIAPQLPMKDVRIIREAGRKPYWDCPRSYSGDRLFFNASHESEVVVLGSSNVEIGVDVMRIETRNGKSVGNFLSGLRRVLVEEEWAYVQMGKDDEEKLFRFLQHWVMKEAYVKALGTGLYTEPQTLQCSVSSPHPSIRHNGRHVPNFNFSFSTPLDGYLVCVCTSAPHEIPVQVNLERLDWPSFVSGSL